MNPLVLSFEIFFVTVDDTCELVFVIATSVSSLKSLLHLLPLVLPHIDGIAAMTSTVLTAMVRECRSSLRSWHLAEACLVLNIECFHALSTATIFNHKFVCLLNVVLVYTAVIFLPSLATLLPSVPLTLDWISSNVLLLILLTVRREIG